MSRPVKNKDERYDKTIPVKFSTADRLRLRARAEKDRIPVSTWIRNAVLDKLNEN